MRLRKECEHGAYDAHTYRTGGHPESSIAYLDCPGGEFLSEVAIVIENVDGEWQLSPRGWLVMNASAAFGCNGGSVGLLYDLLAALDPNQQSSREVLEDGQSNE